MSDSIVDFELTYACYESGQFTKMDLELFRRKDKEFDAYVKTREAQDV